MICTRCPPRLRHGGLGLCGHPDEMRVQNEGLIGLARPSTLSLQAGHLPGSFPLSFVLTARTNLEEKGREPCGPGPRGTRAVNCYSAATGYTSVPSLFSVRKADRSRAVL